MGIVLDLTFLASLVKRIEGQVPRDPHQITLGFRRGGDAVSVFKEADERLLEKVLAQGVIPAQGKDVVEHVLLRRFVKGGEGGRVPFFYGVERSFKIHGHYKDGKPRVFIGTISEFGESRQKSDPKAA